jgi:hypothetical protein
MSTKLLRGLLVSAALIAPGVALADPPNWGQCVSEQNRAAKAEDDDRGTEMVEEMFKNRDKICEVGDAFPGEGAVTGADMPGWDKTGKNPNASN